MCLDAGVGTGVHWGIDHGLVTLGKEVGRLTRQKNTDVVAAKQLRVTKSEM